MVYINIGEALNAIIAFEVNGYTFKGSNSTTFNSHFHWGSTCIRTNLLLKDSFSEVSSSKAANYPYFDKMIKITVIGYCVMAVSHSILTGKSMCT